MSAFDVNEEEDSRRTIMPTNYDSCPTANNHPMINRDKQN
jgi:hypothetical protein